MDHEVRHAVAIAKFIALPENVLDKVVFDGKASPSSTGGRVGITIQVAGDDIVLSVVQSDFQRAL